MRASRNDNPGDLPYDSRSLGQPIWDSNQDHLHFLIKEMSLAMLGSTDVSTDFFLPSLTNILISVSVETQTIPLSAYRLAIASNKSSVLISSSSCLTVLDIVIDFPIDLCRKQYIDKMSNLCYNQQIFGFLILTFCMACWPYLTNFIFLRFSVVLSE